MLMIKKDVPESFGLDNIRPIALTSVMFKVIERVLYKSLLDFVNSHDMLNAS